MTSPPTNPFIPQYDLRTCINSKTPDAQKFWFVQADLLQLANLILTQSLTYIALTPTIGTVIGGTGPVFSTTNSAFPGSVLAFDATSPTGTSFQLLSDLLEEDDTDETEELRTLQAILIELRAIQHLLSSRS